MFTSKSIKHLEERAEDYSRKASRIYKSLEAMPHGKAHTARPLAERVEEFNRIYSYPKGDGRKMLILDRVGHGMYCEAARLRFFAARARRQKMFAPRFVTTAIFFVVGTYFIGFRSPQFLAIAAVASVAFSYLSSLWMFLQHLTTLYISVTANQELRSVGTELLWPSKFMCRAGIESVLSGETDDEPHLVDVEWDWLEIVEEALKEPTQEAGRGV